MTRPYPTVLSAAERVVKALIVLNVVYGSAVLLLLVASVAESRFVFVSLAGSASAKTMIAGIPLMRLLMVVGLAAVPITNLVLVRLRDMLTTVRHGDPFTIENARRLQAIAFGVLGLEVLRLIAGMIVTNTLLDDLGVRIRSGFSLTPWLAVLLLFVLARVFEYGAELRADLDGTV